MDRPASPRIRYDGLDAVRAFAMLLGVAYHAAYAWFPDVGPWYFVADESPVPSLVFFVGFSHAWRMQLFFALSGFFAHLVFERRGPKAFLKDRAHRLLVPFVFALPLTLLVDWLTRVASHERGLMHADYYAGAGFRFAPLHLWFLIYLFSFCLTAFVLPSMEWPKKALEFALKFPPLLLLFAVPAYFAPKWHPENRPDQFFWPMPFEWVHYGAFFLFGWLLWSARDHVSRLQKWAPLFLVSGIWLGFHLYDGALQWELKGKMQSGVLAWLITLGALGISFLIPPLKPSAGARVLRFLTDASYWVYLLHYPLILAMQWGFATTALDGRLEYALTVTLTLAVLFGVYASAVRQRRWAQRLGVSS